MKKLIALILTVVLLLSIALPIAAEQQPEDQNPGQQQPEQQEPENQEPENQEPENQEPENQEPENQEPEEDESDLSTFKLVLDSAKAITDNVGLDSNTTTVLSYDETENAMKVAPSAAGKAPARFRVTYPSGAGAIKADASPIIAVLVKPSVSIHEKTAIRTRTTGTNEAKSATATLGESSSKVETWGVINNNPKLMDLEDGYKLMYVNLNDTTTYAKKSDNTIIQLVEGTTIVSTFIDLLPYSGWQYDESVYFYVKSVYLFESEDDALLNFGFQPPQRTAAYTVGDEFVSFWQTDDNKYFVPNSDGSWVTKGVGGAVNGSALYCEEQASSADGSGFTFTFAVPAEGDYTVWARVLYPNQSSNSLHYNVDGGDAKIWDFADEDASDDKSYNSWQYFALSERKAGTYTDTTLYGAWTIEKGDFRHAQNVLHLTAGQHTIKITGRESGMYIDEFIVTSYGSDEYDPNACTGNDKLFDTCKFCGTNVKHYYADVYSVSGVTAHDYFRTTLHTDAQKWTIPAVTVSDTTDSGSSGSTIDESNKGKVPNIGGGSSKNENKTEETTADTAAPETEAMTEEKKGGCGSAIGTASAVIVGAVALFGTAIGKKQRRE